MDESSGEKKLGGRIGSAGKYFADKVEKELEARNDAHYKLVEPERMKQILIDCQFQIGDLGNTGSLAKLSQIEPLDGIVFGDVRRVQRDVYVTLKAIGVPSGTTAATVMGILSMDIDLAAQFGESCYVPPEDDGQEIKESKILDDIALSIEDHPLADRFAKPPFRVEIIAAGQALPFFKDKKDLYVPADAGQAYSIRLNNKSEGRVVVALLIDGLNTIGQTRDCPSEALKWVLNPGQTANIKGWQMDDATAHQFVFKTAAESVAARQKFCDDIGLITAVFYKEKGKRGTLGTGDGANIESAIKKTKVDHEDTPAAILNIRYDLAEMVRKMEAVK